MSQESGPQHPSCSPGCLSPSVVAALTDQQTLGTGVCEVAGLWLSLGQRSDRMQVSPTDVETFGEAQG